MKKLLKKGLIICALILSINTLLIFSTTIKLTRTTVFLYIEGELVDIDCYEVPSDCAPDIWIYG